MRTYTLTSFIWKFIRQQKWIFLAIFLVSFIWSLDLIVWPYILRKVIDIMTNHEADRWASWTLLKTPVLWALLFWLSVEIGFRIQGFLMARAFPKLEANIRMAMFDHIQYHSPKYFNEHFSGALSNKISDMTTHVSQILQQLMTAFIPALAAAALAVILFIQLNALLGLVLILWLVIHGSVCVYYSKKCNDYENMHAEVRSHLMGKIVDSFTNNFVVNLFYRFVHEKSSIKIFQKEEQLNNYQAKYCVEMMRFYLGIACFLGCCIGINGLMIYSWLSATITTGEVAQIFNTSWNIVQIMWILGFTLPMLFQSFGIAKQALTVMNDPSDVADHPRAAPLIVSKGEIVFDNVSFQYGKNLLFKNKDVHIRGGERIGLVGYSGAGKSSFVNLILRFFPIDSGQILIDGQNISNVSLESLRRQIALIPQDPLLFHRSLKDNILYGNPQASEAEMIEAAKMAHCDKFIQNMPEGYETKVGERGTKLSGGERQRIAIARAILADAPILILDEATSALDSVTEKYIQDSLHQLMQKRTTIVIAHRLSTLAEMERILVFKQGKIVEQGSHQELLNKKGHYAHMWSMQAGGFLPEID